MGSEMMMVALSGIVIPAKAGIAYAMQPEWIPAFAGMTEYVR